MTDQSTISLAPSETSASDKIRQLGARLGHFMREHIYPNEQTYFSQAERLGPWAVAPIIEEFAPAAFLPPSAARYVTGQNPYR